MISLILSGILLGFASGSKAIIDPVDFVNIQGGTDSKEDFSHGGSLPLITRPWAFCNWAPLTESGTNWWFAPTSRKFYGMRITHQPSPWIADYGNFVVKANIPQSAVDNDYGDYIGYSPSKSTFSPYYFKTTFMTGGTMTETSQMEFTATRHGGAMKLQFPSYVDDTANAGFFQDRRISVLLNGGSDTATVSNTLLPDGTTTISGYTVHASGSVPSNFAYYFVVAIYAGPLGNKPTTAKLTYNTSSVAYADFNAEDELYTNFVVRIGTSLISLEQAIVALNAEVSTDKTFVSLVAEAKEEWNGVMSRAVLEDVGQGYSAQETKDKYTTFYSTLYRMSLYPRQLTEIDSTGAEVHYSPYDGQIHSGPYSTDSGFWDAYSTVYPLLSLINRPVLTTTLNGWLNAYKEGGWLPTWSSPANRGSMVGTMGDVTFADAIVKEIPGFDVDVAYEAIRKDAFESQPVGVSDVGRACLNLYTELGYVPSYACSEAVSRTLNYLQSDWAIARAAEKLGKTDDMNALDARAAKYDMLFDNSTLFFRGRNNVTLKFTSDFDQFAWGGDYTEGGPYQYKYYLPWNPSGLNSLYSNVGMDMCDDIQHTQTMTSAFHIGGYSSEIHEMTEMTENCWGQYAHNNQPSHYMLYMFGAIDTEGFSGSCAARGQYWLRKATSTLYKPGADMFPGDEDNGQMAAWYLLSSMGLYSLSPGSTVYNFGSPLFGRVSVNIGDDDGTPRTLTIIANNNSADNVYVQSITWNGVAVASGVNTIEYAELIKGGELVFEMGSTPVSSARKAIKV